MILADSHGTMYITCNYSINTNMNNPDIRDLHHKVDNQRVTCPNLCHFNPRSVSDLAHTETYKLNQILDRVVCKF